MLDLHCGALDNIKIDATFRESGFMCVLKSTQQKQKTSSQHALQFHFKIPRGFFWSPFLPDYLTP
jgi:hypothetical protein